jgi:MFS family permease
MSQTSTAAPSIDEEQRHKAKIDIEQPAFSEKQNDMDRPLTDEKETEPTQRAPATMNPWHPSQFPDGGKSAYLCLLGAFCCLFCSFGWLNCLGVFQNYYQLNQLRSYSASTIAWIPSIQIFVMFFPGPIVGWIYDNHGPRHLLIFGTFFHVFGLMMTSLCTEYYQFFLAQGICSPLGLNCIFQAGTSTIPTWFLKKRGLAYGIMAAGSGLGGVIFPIMASHLIPKVGFAWTMRIIAFTILGMCIVASLTVTSRLPPKPRALELKVFLDPFKDARFNLVTISSFLFFLGLFIPINFIEVQALNAGMSTRLAGYLLSVLNACR